MSELVHNLGRLRRENQRIFINTQEIFGVQSVNSSFDVQHQPLKHIGQNNSPNLIYPGNQNGNVSISQILVTNDQFLPFTGESGFNGYVLRRYKDNSTNYSFTSGYLTSYSSRCSIGEIPQVDVNLMVLDNLGNIPSGYSLQTSGDFNAIAGLTDNFSANIAGYGSISINLSDFTTNRVLGYNLEIQIPRNPVYRIGRQLPEGVFTNYPLEVTCSFDFDRNDYANKELRDFLCNPTTQNLTLTLKNYLSSATIQTFTFNSMKFVGESYKTDANGNVSVTTTYKKFL